VTGLAQLGRGCPFPLAVDSARPGLGYVDGPEKVRQAILIVLETEPGERVMRPTFGAGLRRYLMEPNTVAVRALIKHDVELALMTWEPRIELKRVDVSAGADPALVQIAIDYVHVQTSRPDNLVHVLSLDGAR
jgi:phage baseplate assembly protein W